MGRQQRITLSVAVIAIAALAVAVVAIVRTRGSNATTTVTRTVTTRATTTTSRSPTGTTTVTRDVGPFTGVRLERANVVTVHVGGARHVSVTGEPRVVRLVTTTVRNGVLVVSSGGSLRTHVPLHVDVTTPTLTSVALAGSGRVTVDGVTAQRFDAELGGNGVLRVSGRAGDLAATLSGVGTADLARLAAHSVHAVLSGAGRLAVTASSALDASLSGAGSIVYSGSPANVKTDVTGAGTITSG